MKNKTLWRTLLVGILAFFFGLFISSNKNPFLYLFIVLAITLIIIIIKYMRKELKKEFIYFSLINFCLLIIGFVLRITNSLSLESIKSFFGPIFFLGALFIISGFVYIFPIKDYPVRYWFGYFFGSIFLLLSIPLTIGFIKDTLNGHFTIFFMITILLFWFYTFISFYLGIKAYMKIRKLKINK